MCEKCVEFTIPEGFLYPYTNDDGDDVYFNIVTNA